MKTENNMLTGNRKTAELVMHTTPQLLPMIMNNIPQAVFWKGRNLVYLGCNQAFADDAGVSTPDEIIGKTDFEMPWKAQAELYRADDRQVMESGKPKLNYEEPQTTPNGSTIWLSTSKIPVFENGQVVAVLAMYEDITARKQAEEALRENQSLYQSLVEVSPLSICRKDLAGRFTFANPRFLELSQITLADLVGKTDFDLHPSELAEKYRHDDLAVMESRQVQELVEKRAVHDGGTTLVQTIKAPIYDGNGKVNGIQISFWDITDRERAEEAILASEERFRRFSEATNEGLVFHEQGRIIDANPAGLAMFGLSDFTEFVGKSLMEFVAPEFHPLVLKQMQLESVNPYEIQCIRKDRSAFPVETSTRTYKIGDRTVRATSIRDVTARKQAESLLQSMIENAPEAIGVIDLTTGLFTQPNENAVKLYGLSREELVKVGPADISPPVQPDGRSSNEKAMEKINLAMQGESPVFEWTHRNARGENIPCEVRLARLPGDLPQVRFSVTDITARKQAEKAIQDSEDRFRRFSEATVEGLVFHEQGRVVDVNPAAVAIFGLSNIEDLIGRNLLEFIAPEYHETVLKQMQLESVAPYEIRGIRKDGSTIPVETSTRAYKLGDRTIRASSIRDITERKRVEAELRQNELLLSNALQIARMGYWDLDIDTQMFIFNDQYYRTFHATTTEEMGGNQMSVMDFIQRFVPPGEGNVIGTGMQEAIETKDPNFQVKLEAQNLTVQGELRWVSVWLTIEKDAQGRTTLIHGVNQDITERKQLEAQVQQAFERRGYQVQIGTEIAQEIASASELSDLFGRVVTLTKERLGYYHTQLLRYDAVQDAVVLIKGYGETGQKMLAGGHKLPMGTGLIGTAAANGQTVMRSTLAEDPDWQPNPLLPETKGEIAVPIKWQDNVLGVLDVQSDQAGALTEDDRLLLEGLCGQIAIAMHNAELVETIRQNEARLAEALRTARLANWEYDVEKEVFIFNDQFYSIFHTTAEKAGGYQLSSARYSELFVHPDDLEFVRKEIGRSLNSPERVFNNTLDHRILYGDGGVGYITAKVTVERDENGKMTRYYGANQDITERKQVEEALRINEARLAEALEIARLAHWEYDVEKDIFTFNDQFYSIFHTTAEQHGGYQLPSAYYAQHFVYPEDLPVVGVEIEKALNSTGRHYSQNVEHRILYADGSIGHMQVSINVDRDENGKITRYYGANQDITERKQAEEALRVNEVRLAEALQTARLAHWEYDVEKDIFTFNDQFYSIFHTTAEKAGGYQIPSARYAELFVHPDDMEVVGTEIGKALSSTERVYNATVDHRIVYEDGGIGYIMVQLTVERDENGKITRYYGANQDITERKQAEEALRINEARLAEALQIARLAHWEYDVEKGIFTFNDQFYSLFHTTAEQHGGYQLPSAYYAQHFVYSDDLPVVGVEIEKALNSTGRHYSKNVEHRILYADGGIGHMQVNINVDRDENGKITRYYGANQDITERIKVQQELAERLEEINRLYQNLSHEGWNAYRDTADLPTGFMYDQTGVRAADEAVLADEPFDNVPIRVLGGEIVGTLTVANDPLHPTSPEDYTFLQQVSDQIALAMESARLSAQTQTALAQSEILFEASKNLAQAADLQELVSTAVNTLKIPEINRAIMVAFNYGSTGDLEDMDVIANWWNGSGHEVTAIGTRYPRQVFQLLPMFISPAPVFFNDSFNDERADSATTELMKSLNIRSGAVLPLLSGTHQIAALILEAEEPHQFTQDETRLYTALAPQITTVLENRRQFERAQKQAERESTLNIISQKIQSATTVEAVLQIAARELGHALGAPMTVAQLNMKDKK